MLYVCVRGVMDVVFSVCTVTRGTETWNKPNTIEQQFIPGYNHVFGY